MAEVVREGVREREIEVEPTEVPPPTSVDAARGRISWAAIFGGAVTALGLWLLLYVFGLAVGLSSIDPRDAGSLRPSGLFAGVWALIAPLVALFVGGWVAGRGGGLISRPAGAIHGLVMWGLTSLVGLATVATLVSTVVAGVFSATRMVAQAGGQEAGAAVGESGGVAGAGQGLGIDASQVLGPVNDRLRAEGKPAISAAQMGDIARGAVQNAAAQGRMDRQALAQSVAANTGLSAADADQVAAQIESQVQARTAQVQESAKAGALKVAEKSSKAFWGAFGTLLLGLIAAVAGGAAGAGFYPRPPRRERVLVRRTVAPPREVYP